MALKYLWPGFAALGLVISLAVHLSTFFGMDPEAAIPGVMWIHILIFPPFIAAIFYVETIEGAKDDLGKIITRAPRWLCVMTAVFFAYGIINFGTHSILSEGGGPSKVGDRHVLTSHGDKIRELNEAEFHQHQAYETRGSSGHWMLFYSASLMLLVGAARLRSNPESFSKEPEQSKFHFKVEEYPRQIPNAKYAFVGLVIYVACVCAILSGYPALAMLSVGPIIFCAIMAVTRIIRKGASPDGPIASPIGCLTLIPNALLASHMGFLVSQFIYLCIYVDFSAAVTHSVSLVFPEEGPRQLSNGELLHNRAWSGLMFLVQFPLFAFGSMGLTYMTELIGRSAKLRKRPEETNEQILP